MKTASELGDLIRRIDGRGYKAYKEIEGRYSFPDFTLVIDHVQGDPFAMPSRLRAQVERRRSGFGSKTTANRIRTTALCNLLIRTFFVNCRTMAGGRRGTGKSGLITIDVPGQQVLESNAMKVTDQVVEARFFMGLPAQGRRISGPDAAQMLLTELPRIIAASLYMERFDPVRVEEHLACCEDADALRNTLTAINCIAFVGDGAVLPRASGIDDRPMPHEAAVRFRSPERLRISVNVPNGGTITGMGIPQGVTLIVGGGFHGKSTLLNALELGIYNHIPGDGRERVVTHPDAVKIRAADGRSIASTDISPFINNLPFNKETTAFSTQNASGSTSQAANICEAVEVGARVLLLDEDTSATNFMIRDHRMQKLVAKSKEPITPFVDKVRQLYQDKGVSTVLVMGGCGDYFGAADHVIQMVDYQPLDVTRQAREIAEHLEDGRQPEGGGRFGDIRERIPEIKGFMPGSHDRQVKITAPRRHEIHYGRTVIDLWDMAQIVSDSQTRALGYAVHYAARYLDGIRTLKAVVSQVAADIDEKGLDILPPYLIGNLARFRKFELAGAINRMRTLTVQQKSNGFT